LDDTTNRTDGLPSINNVIGNDDEPDDLDGDDDDDDGDDDNSVSNTNTTDF
jgi:hypothetical protein